MNDQKYKMTEGKHSETSAIRNILLNLGFKAPHTGEPYSEEMLLGIGGGIRSSYFTFELNNYPFLVLGARHLFEGNKLPQDICSRLKIFPILKESTSHKLAQNNLNSTLKEGLPVLVWVDLASMPYFYFPEEMKQHFIHTVVVYNYDEKKDTYFVYDISKTPLKISEPELAEARSKISSLKNRLLIVKPLTPKTDLRSAIFEGIKQCCDNMLNPKINFFGVESISSWAELITNFEDKRGWMNLFPPGIHLYRALNNVYYFIETAGGNALRKMYADFLVEAAPILPNLNLNEIAARYYNLSSDWGKLADSALDDSVSLFSETKQLLKKRTNLFLEDGMKSKPERKKITKRLKELEKEISENFPLNKDDVLELLFSMKRQIQQIYIAEKETINILNKVIQEM